MKRKSRDPYVKYIEDSGPSGATVVDMDQKYRWYPIEDLVELE